MDSGDDRAEHGSSSQAAPAVEQVQRQAGQAAEAIGAQGRNTAEQQKNAGADQVGGVAHAMHAAADDLQDKLPTAAEYIDDMAARLGGVASALRERSVDEVIGNVTDFARAQPMAFFAGAVATGFALSRFARSSAKRGA
jgi:uncharacterized phage infection (PIP) family protein YhgE